MKKFLEKPNLLKRYREYCKKMAEKRKETERYFNSLIKQCETFKFGKRIIVDYGTMGEKEYYEGTILRYGDPWWWDDETVCPGRVEVRLIIDGFPHDINVCQTSIKELND